MTRRISSEEFPNKGRYQLSTVPAGIEIENFQQGSSKKGNDVLGNENQQVDTNRKASVATINSQGQERCRKMSRDVVPTLDNYRSIHQHQAQNMNLLARRPTMHELCNPTTVAMNEETLLQDLNKVILVFFFK